MVTKSNRIKCDYCGRFISMNEENIFQRFEPATEFSPEYNYIAHAECREKMKIFAKKHLIREEYRT